MEQGPQKEKVMSLFKFGTDKEVAEAFSRSEKLIRETIVEVVTGQVADSLGDVNEYLDKAKSVTELKEQIVELEIEKAKIDDDNARAQRRIREVATAREKEKEAEFAQREEAINHRVGLEKDRQERDAADAKVKLALGRREAKVEAAEGHLTEQLKTAAEQQDFMVKFFKQKDEETQTILNTILASLPKVEAMVSNNSGPAHPDSVHHNVTNRG